MDKSFQLKGLVPYETIISVLSEDLSILKDIGCNIEFIEALEMILNWYQTRFDVLKEIEEERGVI